MALTDTAAASTATNAVQIGVGLWSMRSTAYVPRSWTALYADLRTDAQLAEELGYDSLWVAEHHFWYDGWCPAPLVAAASALGATQRLRVGTAMHLLPQHDPDTVRRDLGTLLDCFGDRIDLGLSLGYRDEEYDAVGIARDKRARLMSERLDQILDTFGARWPVPPPVYVGGIAEPAVRRAGRRGLSLLLPNSLADKEISARAGMAAQEATARGLPTGRTGVLVDVWIVDSPADADAVRERLAVHYREYAGAWFRLRGQPGFSRPDLLDKQSDRTRAAAVVGTAEQVTQRLVALRDIGVSTFVLQVRADLPAPEYRAAMTALAQHVCPVLRGPA